MLHVSRKNYTVYQYCQIMFHVSSAQLYCMSVVPTLLHVCSAKTILRFSSAKSILRVSSAKTILHVRSAKTILNVCSAELHTTSVT
jgi:hypothetical protein